ncbi:MAG: FAD-dependent oxidoreductase [Bacteroidales bacterium]
MLDLKNPFIFAPIKLGYSNQEGYVNERHISFYRVRAPYVGAITPEPLYLDKGLREVPTQMGIDEDNKIEGLKRLTKAIHQFSTKVVAHLNHPGRMANPKIPGNYFVSSTDKPCENGGAIPKRMDKKEADKVAELFVNAAVRAEKANFDIIELQFGHGYLLSQFISPFVNDRKDEYGGSFENRIKFPLAILKAVKNAVKIPVIARISGDEMIPQGIKLPEMINFSRKLEYAGIDAIHVSAGTVCSTPPWFFQHMFVPKGKTWDMASNIQDNINVPVIFVGQINTFEDIETIKHDYNADYIAIGRGLVADPYFIGKYLGKEKGPLRPCLACAEGCLGGVKSGVGLHCLVNPEAGNETESFKIAPETKNYAVIGGGLAGMEAAITLDRRGHYVDLYEKNHLGGQFNLAPLTPHKKSMERLVPYFIEEIKERKIKVIYKEATNADLRANYDGIILATGSVPAVPKINGLDNYFWADILLEENLPKNEKIMIIGGGLIGVDIATALISKGNKIIIVKRTTDFGEDMEMIAKNLSLRMMNEKGTIFSDKTQIKKIEGNTVYAERHGDIIQFKNIDRIIVSTGMKSYNPLENLLSKNVYVCAVGDAKEIGNAQDAICDAYNKTKNI